MKDNTSATELVQVILDNSNRINEAIDNMLDVTQIDSDTLTLKKNELQLDLVLQGVNREFEKALAERNIQIDIEGLNTLPVVSADPELLHKAFYHILSNAIKFTPDGGKIYVTGHVIINTNGASTDVEISFRDTGIGIDPVNQELIFEKFYQTGDSLLHLSGKTKFKGGGPGLGLVIVRGILEAHHGQVWVESPGHDEETCPGSTIYIRLPLMI